jgi:hypothetical protein
MPENTMSVEASTTQVNVAPAPDAPLGTPEHAEKAMAAADNGLDTSGSSQLLAGKYKTSQDLERGVINAFKAVYGSDHQSQLVALYKSLESEIGKKNSPAKQESKPSDANETASPETPASPPVTEKQTSQPVEKAAEDNQAADAGPETKQDTQDQAPTKVDRTAVEMEWAKDGKLSDASYDQLAKAGYERDRVDVYLEGIAARQEKVFARVQGKQNYQKMVEWAFKNMPEQDIKAYDSTMQSGNQAQIALAVDGLHQRYIKAVGQPATRKVVPQSGEINTNSAGYQSREQFLADMRDARYQRDPAYRQGVMERLRVTTAF